jgi:hypothetical protein
MRLQTGIEDLIESAKKLAIANDEGNLYRCIFTLRHALETFVTEKYGKADFKRINMPEKLTELQNVMSNHTRINLQFNKAYFDMLDTLGASVANTPPVGERGAKKR